MKKTRCRWVDAFSQWPNGQQALGCAKDRLLELLFVPSMPSAACDEWCCRRALPDVRWCTLCGRGNSFWMDQSVPGGYASLLIGTIFAYLRPGFFKLPHVFESLFPTSNHLAWSCPQCTLSCCDCPCFLGKSPNTLCVLVAAPLLVPGIVLVVRSTFSV